MSTEFSIDSEENARRAGVDTKKTINTVFEIGNTVMSAWTNWKEGNAKLEEIKKDRYALGLLLPTENRHNLERLEEIPEYYHAENVNKLISEDLLPFGWSELSAVEQGFSTKMAMQMLRQRSRDLTAEKLEERNVLNRIADVRNRIRSENAVNRAESMIRQIRGSVV